MVYYKIINSDSKRKVKQVFDHKIKGKKLLKKALSES